MQRLTLPQFTRHYLARHYTNRNIDMSTQHGPALPRCGCLAVAGNAIVSILIHSLFRDRVTSRRYGSAPRYCNTTRGSVTCLTVMERGLCYSNGACNMVMCYITPLGSTFVSLSLS